MTTIAYEKYGDHLELPRDSYKPEWRPLTLSACWGGTGKTVECWFRVALEYSAEKTPRFAAICKAAKLRYSDRAWQGPIEQLPALVDALLAAGLMPADYHSRASQDVALVWAGAVNPIALEGQRRLLAELTGDAD